MQETKKDECLVLGVGELLWDLLPQGKVAGGAPFNFAFHATQAGLVGTPVSRVGHDDLGKSLVELVQTRGLNTSLIQVDESFPTGTVTVELQAGVPHYTIHSPSAWDQLSWTAELETAAKNANAVCFGTLAQRNDHSRHTIQKLVKTAHEAGALTIADLNLRQHYYTKEILEESIRLAEWVKLSSEDWAGVAQALYLPASDPFGALSRFRKKHDLELIAFTDGENGAWLCTEQGQWKVPPVPVQVADTVGAGDAFTAGLLAAWWSGADWKKAGTYASALAAEVVSRSGGTPLIEPEIMAGLKKKYLE